MKYLRKIFSPLYRHIFHFLMVKCWFSKAERYMGASLHFLRSFFLYFSSTLIISFIFPLSISYIYCPLSLNQFDFCIISKYFFPRHEWQLQPRCRPSPSKSPPINSSFSYRTPLLLGVELLFEKKLISDQT